MAASDGRMLTVEYVLRWRGRRGVCERRSERDFAAADARAALDAFRDWRETRKRRASEEVLGVRDGGTPLWTGAGGFLDEISLSAREGHPDLPSWGTRQVAERLAADPAAGAWAHHGHAFVVSDHDDGRSRIALCAWRPLLLMAEAGLLEIERVLGKTCLVFTPRRATSAHERLALVRDVSAAAAALGSP